MDFGYSGPRITWEIRNLLETNNNEILDRGVANDKWLFLFPNGQIRHPHSFLNHFLLLLNMNDRRTLLGESRFRFEA